MDIILAPIIPKPKVEICSMDGIDILKRNQFYDEKFKNEEAQKIEIFTELSHF